MTFKIGDEICYLLTYTNTGEVPLTGITISESLPNLTFTTIEGTITSATGSTSVSALTYDTTTNIITVPETLGLEGSIVIKICGTATTAGEGIVNTAVAGNDQTDDITDDETVDIEELVPSFTFTKELLSNPCLGDGTDCTTVGRLKVDVNPASFSQSTLVDLATQFVVLYPEGSNCPDTKYPMNAIDPTLTIGQGANGDPIVTNFEDLINSLGGCFSATTEGLDDAGTNMILCVTAPAINGLQITMQTAGGNFWSLVWDGINNVWTGIDDNNNPVNGSATNKDGTTKRLAGTEEIEGITINTVEAISEDSKVLSTLYKGFDGNRFLASSDTKEVALSLSKEKLNSLSVKK